MSENLNNTHQHVQYPYPTYPYYYPTSSPAYYPTTYGKQQAPVNQQTAPTRQQTLPPSQQQQQVQMTQQGVNVPGMLPIQQSYIENILRLNRGKLAKVYMTFENNNEWNAKIFRGIIEAAGRDHIILSDPDTGHRFLLLMIYLDYVEFDQELNYSYPGIAGNTPGLLSSNAPR